MLKYGEDYPDACPPSEANEMEGSFYRMCNSAVPEKDDFNTQLFSKSNLVHCLLTVDFKTLFSSPRITS